MANALVGTANFSASEYEKHSTGNAVPDQYAANAQATLELLQRIRDVLGSPIFITSGYRSPDHNKEIGGVTDSQHMTADAADFDVPFMSRHAVAVALDAAQDSIAPYGQLIYYSGFDNHFHVGTGTKQQQLIKNTDGTYSNYSDASQIPQGFAEFVVVIAIAIAGVALAFLIRHMGR